MERNDSHTEAVPTRTAASGQVLSRREMLRSTAAGLLSAAAVLSDSTLHAAEKKAEPKPLRKITDAEFAKEVLQSPKPVVVECYADWCGACKIMAKDLEALQEKFADQVIIVQMNVDETSILQRYGGNRIPYCLYFTNGHAMDSSIGAKQRGVIELQIKRLIEAHERSQRAKKKAR